MTLLICPGIHELILTASFLQVMQLPPSVLVFPAERDPPYSALHLLAFLRDRLGMTARGWPYAGQYPPLTLLGFSAGVVGVMGLAGIWQQLGGQVRALIALDGWGMPLWGSFPIHRVSHDPFTHWSSIGLGSSGHTHFYAEPAVSHLALWEAPHQAMGYRVVTNPALGPQRQPTTAAEFLRSLLRQYGELPDQG